MLEAGNAKARARASRNLDALKKKAELYLLEKAGRCLLAAGGLSPPDSDLENELYSEKTFLLAREAARQQASLFSPRGFQRGSAPLPPEAFFLFAS